MTNQQIILRRRPEAVPSADNVEIVSAEMPPVPAGGVLRKTIYLSLDPYMGGRMRDAPSYAASGAVGAGAGQIAKIEGSRA
jgi:hypothetical protein